MGKNGSMRQGLLVLACSCLVACGGGGDGGTSDGDGSGSTPPPSGGGTTPPPSSGGSSGAAVTATLTTGAYLEFLATSTSTSSTSGGTSNSSDYGFFRITLGAPKVVGGVSGFAVAVTGKTLTGGVDFRPAWTFLGLSGQRWVGSNDGSTLVTLYDPALPAGTTGFFIDVPSGRNVSSAAATFDGAYNDYTGVALRDATSDGGCQTVAGATICSDSATTFSQAEYLKDGVGPVAFSQRIGYTVGGAAPQVINSSVKLELTATSLTPRDGSTIKAPPWTDIAAMPVARVGAFAAAIGNKIYLYGGSSSDSTFTASRIDVFDVSSGTWSRGPDAPRALSGYAVTVGNRIALIGGGYLHDPAAGTFTPIAPLTGVSGLLTGVGAWKHADGSTDVVAVIDPGAIYTTATLYRYTVATNTWSEIGDFQKNRFEYETVMAGDTFYVIGGFSNGSYLSSTIAVDLAASSYRTLDSRLSAGLISTSPAVLGGKVYVTGGYNFGGASRDVQILDPATGIYAPGPAMFAGRYSAATAAAGGKLYVMGGTVAGSTATSSTLVSVLTP